MKQEWPEVDRREHCDVHHENTLDIKATSSAVSSINGGVTVLKWLIGLGLPLLITGVYTINTRLETINIAVHSIALDQVAVKTEIKSLEDRLCFLEGRQKRD